MCMSVCLLVYVCVCLLHCVSMCVCCVCICILACFLYIYVVYTLNTHGVHACLSIIVHALYHGIMHHMPTFLQIVYCFHHSDEVNEVMIKSSWSGMLAALSLLLNAWYFTTLMHADT